jgi:hypothetical protein
VAFNHSYQEKWLTTALGRRIIREIDKSEVNDEGTVIFSPALGSIPPEKISGGAKALFLAQFDSDYISSICFGDNCAEILLEISETKDVKIVANHLLDLNETVGKSRKVYFPELKVYAKDDEDYVDICVGNIGKRMYF